MFKTAVSIVICTLDRWESLNETLTSLAKQTCKDFEVILITEKGDLSVMRDRGLKAAIGDIVTFIDDDVYCEPTWLQGIVENFKNKGVVGVTGPTIITREFFKNRDSIRFKKLYKLQEWIFGVPPHPGRLSNCGTPSMGSNFERPKGRVYEGPVDYLECCNMSVRKKEALDVGGFDHHYYRTSEWCEVDLSLSLKAKGVLWFSPQCKLYHRPSKQGVYAARLRTRHRWDNFMYFQRKWTGKHIKSGFRTELYRRFVWLYFALKQNFRF